MPAEQNFIVADDTIEDTVDESDDVVIVPAPPTEALAHVPPPRSVLRAGPIHRSNTLFLRQTLIPILLSLGVICLAFVAIGFLSPSTSPYSVLSRAMFAVPAGLVGLVMLGLGIVNVLQVRHELHQQHPR